jgi:PII-like signaling protein
MRTSAVSRFPSHPGKRVTMMLCRRDHAGHGSLMIELLQRARRAKLAGATVFEALEGYGATGRVHRPHFMVADAPVSIVIVEQPDRIDSFLEDVVDLLDNVLVIVDDIDIVEV